MPRCNAHHLLTTLEAAIGRESARLEFKWMSQALSSAPPPHPITRHAPLPDLPTMVARRVRGEPLQYILGTQPFGPLQHLRVRAPVLIPRPETEEWALRLSRMLAPSPRAPVRVLDLCTGTGCIPLLLCAQWPPGSTLAVGVDISPAALELAAENAAVCGIPTSTPAAAAAVDDPPHAPAPAPTNVFVPFHGDLRDPARLARALPFRPFHVLTANPPYIPRAEYDALPPSVRDFEDPAALLGDPPGARDPRGLAFYRHIARALRGDGEGARVLADGALVALEVGDGQARAVERILLDETPLRRTEVWEDAWGKERVVVARG